MSLTQIANQAAKTNELNAANKTLQMKLKSLVNSSGLMEIGNHLEQSGFQAVYTYNSTDWRTSPNASFSAAFEKNNQKFFLVVATDVKVQREETSIHYYRSDITRHVVGPSPLAGSRTEFVPHRLNALDEAYSSIQDWVMDKLPQLISPQRLESTPSVTQTAPTQQRQGWLSQTLGRLVPKF